MSTDREKAIREANALVEQMKNDIDNVIEAINKETEEKKSFYLSVKTRLNYIWENDAIDYDKKHEMLLALQRSIIVKCMDKKTLMFYRIMAAAEVTWRHIIWPKQIVFLLIFAIAMDYLLGEKIYPFLPVIIIIEWVIGSIMVYRNNADRWSPK